MNENLTFNDLPKAIQAVYDKMSTIESLIQKHFNTPKEEQVEKLMSIKDASSFLNLSVPTIYSKVSRNEIPYMKRGKRLYFSNKDLINYLKEGRNKTQEEIQHEADAYLCKLKKD
ncbi:helix-turn-helix domain-containing protein [Psychroflexus montanilacus]|uniref:helix-turn-helix domain-containing protein n=1 Tax=Psychroflexus montanilacus TaxID=2873598 RepID=UPI001CCD53F3|nr:helix-turn-helix domain-containing protein [Psychroflexus montanilacus]MBZ9650622.1 helix-turn-helix domain-containing protein [Psychroflexus montanilacus]